MSVAGSSFGRWSGRNSKPTNVKESNESDIPTGFKQAKASVSGRRYQASQRSEVEQSIKAYTLWLPDTTKELEHALYTSVEAPIATLTNATVLDEIPRVQQTSNESALASSESKPVNHKHGPSTTEINSETFDQPFQAQMTAMDSFRTNLDPVESTLAVAKGSMSETSSLEVITHTSEKQTTDRQGPDINQKPSCWSRVAVAEEVDPGWDSHSHDVERLGPLVPPTTLNTLPKYRPKNGPKVMLDPAESSFMRQLARGAVQKNLPRLGQTKAVEKLLLRTDANFPALQSLQQSSPKNHTTSPVPQLGTPHPLKNITSNKAHATASIDRDANLMDPTTAKNQNSAHLMIDKTVDTKANVKNSMPPHLRPNTKLKDITADTEMNDDNMPPHLRAAWSKPTAAVTKRSTFKEGEKTELLEQPLSTRQVSHPQAHAKVGNSNSAMPSKQPPHLQVSAQAKNPESAISAKQPPHLQASVALTIKSTNSNPASAQQKARKQANLPDTKLLKSTSKDAVPNDAEIAMSAFRDDDKGSDFRTALKSHKTSTGPRNKPPYQSGNDASVAHIKKSTMKEKETQFPWITEAFESHLGDWAGNLIPAPVGDEWTMRDRHDPMGTKRLAVVENWATDQAQDQEANPVAIDVKSLEFLTGEGLAGGDDGLQQAIEASLHSAQPDRSTVNEAKRLLTAADAINERIARGNLPDPEAPEKVEEPKDRHGFTKAERRARRQEARDFEKNYLPQPSEYAPQANIYMRPAEAKDLPLITALHKTWVENSVSTPYVKPLTEAEWRATFFNCQQDSCPFIVAIISQGKVLQVKDVRRLKFEPVVGFAYAMDFGEPDNAYRCSVEIEIWVDQRHQHTGIAKTLLDRMLTALCPMYAWKDPVPFLDDGNQAKWIGGGHRLVKTIMCNLLYTDDEKESFLKWKKEWLARFLFKEAGVIPYVGRKFSRPVNLCQMYYTTAQDVSHIR